MIRCSATAVFALLCVGRARHYSGRVVDVHGRPVAYARIEGSGMRGGMITGEDPFTVRTVADANGEFTLVSSDWPGRITATSLDSKRHGSADLSVSQPPVTIVVRRDVTKRGSRRLPAACPHFFMTKTVPEFFSRAPGSRG
jgi:hypothetical protein